MIYYIFIQDGKLNGCGECKSLNDNILNLEVEQDLYNAYAENPEMYIWDGMEVVIDPEYEAKQAQKEKERIGNLKLTKREVFLGLFQAKGVTPDMLKAQITDPQALIEFEYANDYYRGNPLIDIVGATLGITPEQLDKFFDTNDFTYLLPPVVEEMTEEENA